MKPKLPCVVLWLNCVFAKFKDTNVKLLKCASKIFLNSWKWIKIFPQPRGSMNGLIIIVTPVASMVKHRKLHGLAWPTKCWVYSNLFMLQLLVLQVLLTFALSFFPLLSFYAHCFQSTLGILRKLTFCFPSYFGITKRNIIF